MTDILEMLLTPQGSGESPHRRMWVESEAAKEIRSLRELDDLWRTALYEIADMKYPLCGNRPRRMAIFALRAVDPTLPTGNRRGLTYRLARLASRLDFWFFCLAAAWRRGRYNGVEK